MGGGKVEIRKEGWGERMNQSRRLKRERRTRKRKRREWDERASK